jgi:hypothetical protein
MSVTFARVAHVGHFLQVLILKTFKSCKMEVLILRGLRARFAQVLMMRSLASGGFCGTKIKASGPAKDAAP